MKAALYERNITTAQTNMGLGFDSTVFGVSVYKAGNEMCLTHKSQGAEAKDFHQSVIRWGAQVSHDDHKKEDLLVLSSTVTAVKKPRRASPTRTEWSIAMWTWNCKHCGKKKI